MSAAATPTPSARPASPSPAAPLLTGPVLPLLVRFALPNLGGLLASALAAMAETYFVGRLGPDALAGMALVFPMVMLQMMLSAGAMGGGVSSAISRALGAGAPERAQALAVHALWIGVAAGSVYLLLMRLFAAPLFTLLGGRGAALQQALAYADVAFLGSVFIWIVNTLSSVLRGCGRMGVPSAVLLVVAVAQVLLAGALGLGWGPLPALGMAGIAAGSVLAYAAGALALFAYLQSGRGGLTLALRGTRLQRPMFVDILRVGAVACVSPLQTVLTILILTRLVAPFGTAALAGYGIGARLEFLLVPMAFSIGVASVPLVGMAIGAGQVARARRVAWTAAALATALVGTIGVVFALWPGLWTHLFTQDAAVLDAAATYFHWAGPCYGLFGLGLSLYFSSMGSGKVLGPVLAGTLRLVLVAAGGLALVLLQAPAWSIYALVALGMAAYGGSTALAVWFTAWGARPAVASRTS